MLNPLPPKFLTGFMFKTGLFPIGNLNYKIVQFPLLLKESVVLTFFPFDYLCLIT